MVNGNLRNDYRTVLKKSRKNIEAEKTLGLKVKPTQSELFSLLTSLKTRIENFRIFPKTLPQDQNTNERRTYHSWFTAWPNIAGRLIGKEN